MAKSAEKRRRSVPAQPSDREDQRLLYFSGMAEYLDIHPQHRAWRAAVPCDATPCTLKVREYREAAYVLFKAFEGTAPGTGAFISM